MFSHLQVLEEIVNENEYNAHNDIHGQIPQTGLDIVISEGPPFDILRMRRAPHAHRVLVTKQYLNTKSTFWSIFFEFLCEKIDFGVFDGAELKFEGPEVRFERNKKVPFKFDIFLQQVSQGALGIYGR